MKRKISLCSAKSATYLYTNFMKQFKKASQHNQIGQMLNSKQVLSVLNYMGFVDEEPSSQQIQLAKTLTKMLSDSHFCLSVKRSNLFKFLLILCDIPQVKQSVQSSFFDEEASGLAMDMQDQQQPLIIIQLGEFDEYGRWSCTQMEKQQIKTVFGSMKAKRISRNQIQSRKRPPKQLQLKETFQPKICLKSTKMAEQRFAKIKLGNQKVQNRLIESRNSFNRKIKQELNRSIERQLQNCTFKPMTNSRCHRNSSQSKQNIGHRSFSQDRLQNLLDKGELYKRKREKLKQLRIRLNQSTELEECTFKPQTTKHSQTTKYVYVRNREKQIERLRQGRKQREYINQVKQRGYPANVSWSQFMNSKAGQQKPRTPILCIDLKILNEQYNINVFEGQNVLAISQKISREHNVPENMWWKVQDLIRKAIQQCTDIKIENNKIVASESKQLTNDF